MLMGARKQYVLESVVEVVQPEFEEAAVPPPLVIWIWEGSMRFEPLLAVLVGPYVKEVPGFAAVGPGEREGSRERAETLKGSTGAKLSARSSPAGAARSASARMTSPFFILIFQT